EANPRLSDGWNQLGTALEGAGRYEEASDVYKEIIDVTPELASEFGLRRASVLLKLEQYDEAEKHARLAERTNASAMHLVLSRVALAKKDFARAESEARAAAADPNDRNAAELLIAQALSQQGKAQEAYALVQQVGVRLSQEGGGAMERFDYVRGDALARMERYDEAMAAFRREIANFPDYRQTYANLYLIYVVLNRRAEANAVLEEMVRAGPGKQTMLFAARTVGALGDDNGEREWKRRAAAAR
ncbi:MAG: tetratricopeptide repeat protein, partial [Thermoanaerobaculia bacterium]